MDIIGTVRNWVGRLAELGVSLLALTIVAELLGLGSVPFMPEGVSVISNVTNVVDSAGLERPRRPAGRLGALADLEQQIILS